MSAPGRDAFLARLPFPADPFQLRAFDAVEAGASVLVSAPTGSGKTLVAAYAIHRALEQGAKAFYTTPLKALSNQKYEELATSHGEEQVGLLTGDTSRRPDAPVVVMTTEVLRNMLLAGSPLVDGLSVVVLDEVHYLQDPYRGGVWEEVIVLAPPGVSLVCLSATVANAAELGEWLSEVRGPTEVVQEQHRPIALVHHFAATERRAELPRLEVLLEDRQPTKAALGVDAAVRRARRQPPLGRRGGPGRGPPLPFRTPRRSDLVEVLGEADLLPAIVFIFSRAACDDAVAHCLRDGLRLIQKPQRQGVRAIAERHVEGISDDELAVLGYPGWLGGLEAGIGAHHAGLVPAFRETVEECFAAGLLKVVFATETLSLGINMPARTVVIERFTKFGGTGRAPLTSGDYAQLTGRAGRRRLDQEGHAVVAWSPEIPLARIAQIAAGEPPALRSSFRPTYNLAVNLVRRYDRSQALAILRRSFAQFQLDRQDHGGGAGSTHRPGGYLADLLGRRLAVLEELGHVRNWAVTEAGSLLLGLYHEADLVLAEMLRAGVLDTEPSIMAGVLSALVFEPRRARRPGGTRRREPGGNRQRRRRKDPRAQLGERRLQELSERLEELQRLTAGVRAIEEVHRVPPSRRAEPALANAMASWARGAPLGTVLEVARADGVELAAGDFVRMVKQLADMVGQVAWVATEPATANAARQALPQLVRGVVAAAEVPAPTASTTGATTPS